MSRLAAKETAPAKYPSITVRATGNDPYRPECDTFLVISSGDGNLTDDEVHLDGSRTYGWFNADELIAAIQRMRVEKPE